MTGSGDILGELKSWLARLESAEASAGAEIDLLRRTIDEIEQLRAHRLGLAPDAPVSDNDFWPEADA